MTSGVRKALAALLLVSTLSIAESWNLQALMQSMADIPSSHSRFVETRHLALLTRPLELKGRLTYERPNRLSKHVLSPFDELISVEGDALTVVNKTKGEQRFISLREQPAMGALIESVRATLAGDLAQLERHYRVELSGARGSWRMLLVPRDFQLRKYVETIALAGTEARLARIEIVETDGARSVMTILHDDK
jgi:outer membrane lipoprotein-sorting protein